MNLISNGSMVVAVLLSLVVVPLTSFLKRDHWPQVVNFLIALVFSVGAGVATTLTTNKVHSLKDFVLLSGLTLGSSTTLFHTYFNGSVFDGYLTKVGSVLKAAAPFVDEVAKTVETTGNKTLAAVAQDIQVVTDEGTKINVPSVATPTATLDATITPAQPVPAEATPAAPAQA